MPAKIDDTVGSAAPAQSRKFSTRFGLNNSTSPVTTTNADAIVDQATSIKGTSIAIDGIASVARDQLAAVRSSIVSATVVKDKAISDSIVTYSHADLERNQLTLGAAAIDSALASSLPGIDLVEARKRMNSLAPDLLRSGTKNLLPLKNKQLKPAMAATPLIDHVRVGMDKNKGTIDCFFSTITFSLPLKRVASGDIAAVRVFRSEIDGPPFMQDRAPLSSYALELLSHSSPRTHVKVHDQTRDIQQHLSDADISNFFSLLAPIDQSTGLRVALTPPSQVLPVIPPSISKPPNPAVQANLFQFVNAATVGSIDASVSKDLNSLRNMQLLGNTLSLVSPASASVGALTVGDVSKLGSQQTLAFNDSLSFKSLIPQQKNNGQRFREIFFASQNKLTGAVIGDLVTYQFDDDTISYGKSYRYYVTSIDENMNESMRSRIVQIDASGFRVPDRPNRVNASAVGSSVRMIISCSDKLVEKFEVYRLDETPTTTFANVPIKTSVLSGRLGSIIDNVTTFAGSNGFAHIGEASNAALGNSSFIDFGVIPGRKFDYRIFSVDIFGNKSESPYQFKIFVPHPSAATNELAVPSITVDTDVKTNNARISFCVPDQRVVAIFLDRRDLSINQKEFTVPGQSASNVRMAASSIRSAETIGQPRVYDHDQSMAWNGFFQSNGDEIVFVDLSSQAEHTYQYRVHGVDGSGRETSYVLSQPTFIVNRTIINSPVNLTSSLIIVKDGSRAAGASISWTNGDIDISPEDLLGSQSKLVDSSVRTLFQLERQSEQDHNWLQFPMSSDTSFFDAVGAAGASDNLSYRPPYVQMNQTYLYRVKAIRSGAFISNYTAPISVFTGLPTLPPTNVRIGVSDTKARPYYVIINWDTADASGVVDKWEINRAVINNFAAAKIDFTSQKDLQNIQYAPFKEVYAESATFESFSSIAELFERADMLLGQGEQLLLSPLAPISKGPTSRSSTLAVGQQYFMDSNVQFGNTYFYRIRAISPQGARSSWSYRGVRVSDDVFEMKLASIISEQEKATMIASQSPLTVKSNILSDLDPAEISSFSLQATSSKPRLPSFFPVRV